MGHLKRVARRKAKARGKQSVPRPNVPVQADSPAAVEFPTLMLREFLEFCPSTWFDVKRDLMISCYQTLRTPLPNPQRNLTRVLLFKFVAGYVFDGVIDYWEQDGVRTIATPGARVEMQSAQAVSKKSPIGSWLILITPVYEKRKAYAATPDQLLSEAAAHCALIYGRIVVHRKLAKMRVSTVDVRDRSVNDVRLLDGPHMTFGSYYEAQPNFSDMIPEHNAHVHAFDGLSRDCDKRVRIALSWYESSFHAATGIEAFLHLWIALEVIVKSRSDVHGAPGIKALLMRHYSLATPADVDAEFRVQSLYDRRNEMVHGGLFDDVHPFVVDFAGLLFRDIFREVVRLPLQGFARAALARETASQVDWATLKRKPEAETILGSDMSIFLEQVVHFGKPA